MAASIRQPRKAILIIVVFTLVSVYYLSLSAQSLKTVTAEKDIQSVLDKQAEAWNAGDVEGYMQGYWKSDSLLFTSGGKIRTGWTATLEKYRNTYDTKEKMGILKFTRVRINFLSPESAWVFGHWELERKNDRPHGVFTLILRKFSNGWKVVHDHTSSSSD